MQDIKPFTARQEIVCAEAVAAPAAMVVFGASGDLAGRKLFASLFELFNRDLLNENFCLLGAGRKQLSDEEFREYARNSIKQSISAEPAEQLDSFLEKFYYASGEYDDIDFYDYLKARLTQLDKKHNTKNSYIFYLSVPPFLYPVIVEKLCRSGLSSRKSPEQTQPRLVVEKPFGRDLQSAGELDRKIHQCFTEESQIYRIDHYLGKETVQNILIFRFANAIFEPVWNRNYIDHVQITIAESLGIEHRGGYYDRAGALRDMFQNYMLQMLSLVAMEQPVSFEADSIRDEKVKLLRSIRPFKIDELDRYIVRGQYIAGSADGHAVPGYRREEGIAPDSKTETFVAAKLFIDNWRWKNVPFYLRTGKRMACKDSEVVITFKKVPHSMFASSGLEELPPNILVLQIQPEEGMSLSFQAKRPGSKICMSTLNMNFSYRDVFGIGMPEAYQRLLLDCMVGDQTLFTRADDVEVTWRLLTPILQAWESNGSIPYEYPAGADSFTAADELIGSDGRCWRKLSKTKENL